MDFNGGPDVGDHAGTLDRTVITKSGDEKGQPAANAAPALNLPALHTIKPGSTLGDRYRLLEAVGEGGMGRVFKALDQQTQESCAVKLMHNNMRDNEVNRQRFEREAQVALGLRHPNVVAVIDFGFTKTKEPYIVMEYLEGESLSDLLQERGTLSFSNCRSVFLGVLSGLSYAHAANVVHRDIKPSNIMLVDNDCERAKIVDFGIARVCKTTGEICPTSASTLKTLATGQTWNSEQITLVQHLTQPGEIFGSPLYMSPEQFNGEEADCRSEVYALGCMLFETLTGVTPLKGKNAMETMYQRISQRAPSLQSVRAGLTFSHQLEMMVARTLEPDPRKRYQTVEELKSAFLNLAEVL